jgi:hypothetical protein
MSTNEIFMTLTELIKSPFYNIFNGIFIFSNLLLMYLIIGNYQSSLYFQVFNHFVFTSIGFLFFVIFITQYSLFFNQITTEIYYDPMPNHEHYRFLFLKWFAQQAYIFVTLFFIFVNFHDSYIKHIADANIIFSILLYIGFILLFKHSYDQSKALFFASFILFLILLILTFNDFFFYSCYIENDTGMNIHFENCPF